MASRSPVVRRHVVRPAPALGRSALVASAYPRMGSGIYLALGVVALHGLGLTPVALVVAGAGRRHGGVRVRRAGPRCSPGGRLGGAGPARDERARELRDRLGDVLGARRDGRALGGVRGAIPERLLGSACSGAWSVAGALVVIGLVAAACIAGMKALGKAVAAFAGDPRPGRAGGARAARPGVAFLVPGDPAKRPPRTAPSFEGLILACALALAAYTGMEAIGEMAADARDPDSDPPPARGGAGRGARRDCIRRAVSLVALMAAPGCHARRTAASPRLWSSPRRTATRRTPSLRSSEQSRCTSPRRASSISSGCSWRPCSRSSHTRRSPAARAWPPGSPSITSSPPVVAAVPPHQPGAVRGDRGLWIRGGAPRDR